MKLAIHDGQGWNWEWIQYSISKKINYVAVNCYSPSIMNILKTEKFTHLMWHFNHANPEDILMSRNVLNAAEKMGIKVFPDFNTAWHFDDKIAQKYLLEAIEAPIVDSWAFFNLKDALKWLKEEAEYPLVAKLRRGAGSYNVRLIKNYSQAKRYAIKLFKNGVVPTPGYLSDAKNKLKGAGNLQGILKRLKKAPGFIKMINHGKTFPKEKGYVYFQKFIEGNTHDLRIAVVNNRAWAFHRKVRDNDFRASGSGMIDYEREVPVYLVKQSIDIANKLKAQSIAFDYVKDETNNYFIVEISYGYVSVLINKCGGYWNEKCEFIEGDFFPEYFILEDLIGK